MLLPSNMGDRLVYKGINLFGRYALGFNVRSRLSADASKLFQRLAAGLLVRLNTHVQNRNHHPLILPEPLPKAGFEPAPQFTVNFVHATNE